MQSISVHMHTVAVCFAVAEIMTGVLAMTIYTLLYQILNILFTLLIEIIYKRDIC